MEQSKIWCDLGKMEFWTDREICEFYDLNPNMTNREYAAQLDITCTELNEILMDRG
jgi:hypothetical protein